MSGLDDEFWKSWTTPVGLRDDGNNGLLVGWLDRGLSIAGVLEMSSLISELFSLLLLQEPSVSLIFRLMDSVGSLLFSANICIHSLINHPEMEPPRFPLLGTITLIIQSSISLMPNSPLASIP